MGTTFVPVQPVPEQVSGLTDEYDRVRMRVFTVNPSMDPRLANKRDYTYWWFDSPDTDKFMVQGSRITTGGNRNRIKIRVGNETGYIRSSAIIWD